MASTRELRRKIKSIRGTQKLTQAMQMVAAAKMSRAISRAVASRTYARLAWQIIGDLMTKVGRDSHPLLAHREPRRVAVIVLTSNRGLAGGLNAQLLRKVASLVRERSANGQQVDIVSMGRKGTQFFARLFKDQLTADFQAPDTVAGFEDILPMSQVALDQFGRAEYDEVVVAFNEFHSTLKQEPIVRTLLPVQIPELREETPEVGEFAGGEGKTSGVGASHDLLFEPDRDRVLELMLPRAVRTQLYQMLLDQNASEHAARMMAMKSATDNAGELITDLTLTMNGIRQAGITQEISEISAGAEALRAK